MIHKIHLRKLIIEPTLKYLDMYTESAVNLLLGTAATESHLGKYLMQVDSEENPQGPALGIYQMEPETHNDVYENYINYRVGISDLLWEEFGSMNGSLNMVFNLKYATAMARIKYWRDSEPLPHADDIEGLAKYWKRVYNTHLGKGTVEEFINNYNKYIEEK